MRIVYIFIGCLVSWWNVQAQRQEIDSLQRIDIQHFSDTAKVMYWQELGYYFYSINPDSSLLFGKKALDFSRKINFQRGMGYSKHRLAITYHSLGNYTEAIAYNFKALQIAESIKDFNLQTRCLNAIGLIYFGQKNIESALVYYQKALEINLKINNTHAIATNLGNIGNVYITQQRYDYALHNLQKAISLDEKVGNNRGKTNRMVILADAYRLQAKYDTAIIEYEKALTLSQKIENKAAQNKAFYGLSKVYQALQKIPLSNAYALQALKLSESINDIEVIRDVAEVLAQNYAAQKNYPLAYQYQSLFMKAKDSISSEEKIRSIRFLQKEYELEKKEQEIQILEKDRTLQEHLTHKQWLMVYGLGAGIGFLILLAYLQFRYTLRQKEDKELLEVQKEKILQQSEELYQQRNELENSYQNIQLLSEIGRKITSSINIASISDIIYANINDLMDATVFGIGLYNEKTESIDFLNIFENGEKLPAIQCYISENSISVWSFLHQMPIFINDMNKDWQNYFDYPPPTMVVGKPTESIIYLPLILPDKCLGVVTVQSFEKDAYTDYHINILKNIAIYATIALQHALLYENLEIKIKERTEEIIHTYKSVQLLNEIGNDIGKKITATLNSSAIVRIIYDNICQLMDVDALSIGIYDKKTEMLDFESIRNGSKDALQRSYTLKEITRPAVWSFVNEKELILNDIEKDWCIYFPTIPMPRNSATLDDTFSLIYIPLKQQDKCIGVFSVRSSQKNCYNDYHLNILRNIAVYTSIALENAEAYHQLDQTLMDLKNAQAQLIQSEKMVSLGQLTAGIAHEINNPINFVYSNVDSLHQNIDDIMSVVEEYKKITPENVSQQLIEVEKQKQKVDFKIALEELDDLLLGIKEGASRTAEIVRSLRTFSRLDEDTLKMTDIHHNIDSTLVMLRNQCKERIEIVREYGNIPEIECFAGKMNQVFMNILSNAVQAIEDKGKIYIKTQIIDTNQICIRIRDTGKGMSEEVLQHIFEPFFTTKDVGKGTGLGLSISLGIVQKHQGTIQVTSKIGDGTEFCIRMPITQVVE